MSAFLVIANAAADLVRAALAPLPRAEVRVGKRRPVAVGLPVEVVVRLLRAKGAVAFAGDARTDWGTGLAFDVYVRTEPGADVYATLDQVLDLIYPALTNAAPIADAGLLTEEPDITWDVDEADQTLGYLCLIVRVSHRTASGSLAAAT